MGVIQSAEERAFIESERKGPVGPQGPKGPDGLDGKVGPTGPDMYWPEMTSGERQTTADNLNAALLSGGSPIPNVGNLVDYLYETQLFKGPKGVDGTSIEGPAGPQGPSGDDLLIGALTPAEYDSTVSGLATSNMLVSQLAADVSGEGTFMDQLNVAMKCDDANVCTTPYNKINITPTSGLVYDPVADSLCFKQGVYRGLCVDETSPNALTVKVGNQVVLDDQTRAGKLNVTAGGAPSANFIVDGTTSTVRQGGQMDMPSPATDWRNIALGDTALWMRDTTLNVVAPGVEGNFARFGGDKNTTIQTSRLALGGDDAAPPSVRFDSTEFKMDGGGASALSMVTDGSWSMGPTAVVGADKVAHLTRGVDGSKIADIHPDGTLDMYTINDVGALVYNEKQVMPITDETFDLSFVAEDPRTTAGADYLTVENKQLFATQEEIADPASPVQVVGERDVFSVQRPNRDPGAVTNAQYNFFGIDEPRTTKVVLPEGSGVHFGPDAATGIAQRDGDLMVGDLDDGPHLRLSSAAGRSLEFRNTNSLAVRDTSGACNDCSLVYLPDFTSDPANPQLKIINTSAPGVSDTYAVDSFGNLKIPLHANEDGSTGASINSFDENNAHAATLIKFTQPADGSTPFVSVGGSDDFIPFDGDRMIMKGPGGGGGGGIYQMPSVFGDIPLSSTASEMTVHGGKTKFQLGADGTLGLVIAQDIYFPNAFGHNPFRSLYELNLNAESGTHPYRGSTSIVADRLAPMSKLIFSELFINDLKNTTETIPLFSFENDESTGVRQFKFNDVQQLVLGNGPRDTYLSSTKRYEVKYENIWLRGSGTAADGSILKTPGAENNDKSVNKFAALVFYWQNLNKRFLAFTSEYNLEGNEQVRAYYRFYYASGNPASMNYKVVNNGVASAEWTKITYADEKP